MSSGIRSPPVVTQVMARDVVSVPANITLYDACEELIRCSVERAPVVNDKGKVVGMISKRDIRIVTGLPFFDHRSDMEQFHKDALEMLKEHRVSEVMSTPVQVCLQTDTVLEVSKILRVGQVAALAVVDSLEDYMLVGLVSRSDLLDHIIRIYEPVPPQ